MTDTREPNEVDQAQTEHGAERGGEPVTMDAQRTTTDAERTEVHTEAQGEPHAEREHAEGEGAPTSGDFPSAEKMPGAEVGEPDGDDRK